MTTIPTIAPYDDPRFPYVITTYRLTEHHTAGGMSRWLSWLSELQPEMFCEVSPELAAECSLNNGGWATIRTMRAEIEARVLVTQRDSVRCNSRPRHSSDRLALSLVEQRARARRRGERLDRFRRRSERVHPGIEGVYRNDRTGRRSRRRRGASPAVPVKNRSQRCSRARFACGPASSRCQPT